MRKLIVMLGLALASTTIALADGLIEAEAEAYGSKVLLPYKKSLKQALLAGMQQGPAAALDTCRLQAPALATSASTDEVRVGRSSHRLRNPENAPKPWMEPLLQQWLDEGERQAAVVELDGSTYGYAEPIVLQPMCSTCHGIAIAPDLQELIVSHYPEDQAVGFEPGDLRGMFWVEFPRAAVETSQSDY